MFHAVRRCRGQDHSYIEGRNGLLKLELSVHSNRDFDSRLGALKKFAVVDTLPAQTVRYSYLMANQLGGQVYR